MVLVLTILHVSGSLRRVGSINMHNILAKILVSVFPEPLESDVADLESPVAGLQLPSFLSTGYAGCGVAARHWAGRPPAPHS